MVKSLSDDLKICGFVLDLFWNMLPLQHIHVHTIMESVVLKLIEVPNHPEMNS